MLKYAYEMGIKIALNESGLTAEQMRAAQRLGAIGGGGVGALGGGLLGKYIGEKVAPTMGVNPERAKLLGALLGGAAGAGLGGFAGHQIPKLWKQRDEEGLGLVPNYYEEPQYYEAPQYYGEPQYGNYETPQMVDAPAAYPPEEQSALGLLPSAYNTGGALSPEYGYYPEY